MGENGQSNCQNSEPQQHLQPIQQTSKTRLADYFVICGLDLDTGLEPDRFAGMKFVALIR